MKKLSLLFILLLISTFIFSQNQVNALEKLKRRGEPPVIKFESATVRDIDGNIYHTIKVGKQIWLFENLQTTRYNDGTKIDCIKSLTTEKYEGNWIKESKNNLGGEIVGRYYKFNLAGCDGIYEGSITKGVLYNYAAMNSNKLCPVGWHVPTDNDWLIFIKTFCKSDKYEWDVELTELGQKKFEKEFNGNYVCFASSGGSLCFTSPNHAWSKDGGHLWSSSGRRLYYLGARNMSGGDHGFLLGLDYSGGGNERFNSYCVRCVKDNPDYISSENNKGENGTQSIQSNSSTQGSGAYNSSRSLAYYIFGNQEELQNQHIINSNGVLTQSPPLNYFVKVNPATAKLIPLYCSKARLLTNHPKTSYSLDSKDGYLSLIINNSASFWSESENLVIMTEK